MFEDILPRNPIPLPEDDVCKGDFIGDLTEEELDEMIEEVIDEFFDNLTGGQL